MDRGIVDHSQEKEWQRLSFHFKPIGEFRRCSAEVASTCQKIPESNERSLFRSFQDETSDTM